MGEPEVAKHYSETFEKASCNADEIM